MGVKPRKARLRNRFPRALRRWSWTCDCGAPGRYGMRPGPQYAEEQGALRALDSHRRDHARGLVAGGTVTDHGVPA